MSGLFEKIGMKPVPMIIFIIAMMFFIAPFSVGIVNLGNCFGTVFSAAAALFFMFNGPAMRLIGTLRKNPVGKVLIGAVTAMIALGIILAVIITCFMISAARDYPKTPDTTVIVLGCKVKDGRPSLMLRRRLDAAYDYLNENKEVTVIVSGGKGSDEIISEAECMFEYLTEKGIAPERIIMEDSSESTYENLKNSKEIIAEKGLNERITIVTDGYHQLRAEMIAGKLDMEADNISAHTSYWLLPTYYVREWFGVTYQFVLG